jgi:hypothetical protein
MDLREIACENEKRIELTGCAIEWYCLAVLVHLFTSVLCAVQSLELGGGRGGCYCLNNATRQAAYV